MWSLLAGKLNEAVRSVMPLVLVVAFMQVAVVGADTEALVGFLAGGALVIAGVVLLFAGLDLGILPMGRFIGAALPHRGKLSLVLGVAFGLGFATTVAEPDVLVLVQQVDEISQGTVSRNAVLYVTALGVATMVAIGMARIVIGFPLPVLLAVAYGLVIALSFFAPGAFVPLAYDAGSVTTGLLTAPVVIALAIGLSSVLAGRSAVADGFGLLGLASIGPIIAVMIMGLVSG